MPIQTKPPPGNYHFESAKSEQTHIGIAYASVPETHPDYYVARMAVEILSGGMSGRLFTEVREKRGLCYSVGASYGSLKDQASIIGYAGTNVIAFASDAGLLHRRGASAFGWCDRGRAEPPQDQVDFQHDHAERIGRSQGGCDRRMTFSCGGGYARWMRSRMRSME